MSELLGVEAEIGFGLTRVKANYGREAGSFGVQQNHSWG